MTNFFSGARRITCPDCRIRTFVQDEPWKRVCLDCYLKAKKAKAPPAPPRYTAPPEPIEPDMLRRLIQLCHPDRHGNSEASNKATGFLLALKAGRNG